MGQPWKTVGVATLAALALASLAGCGSNPRMISRDEEVRMGRMAAAAFETQNGGRDRDARRNALATTVGARIGAAANAGANPDYPYEFRTLANDEVNANAFPGGIIYLWTGLYSTVRYDEEQLAWVAGHEAAHVSRQHAVRRVERALGYELIVQLLLGQDKAGSVAQAMGNLTLQDYGRDQELEADRVGAMFARDAGYDPTAALAVLAAFKQTGREAPGLELLFASNPGNNAREDSLKAFFRSRGWAGKYYRP